MLSAATSGTAPAVDGPSIPSPMKCVPGWHTTLTPEEAEVVSSLPIRLLTKKRWAKKGSVRSRQIEERLHVFGLEAFPF